MTAEKRIRVILLTEKIEKNSRFAQKVGISSATVRKPPSDNKSRK